MTTVVVGCFSFGASPATDQGIWLYDTITTTWTHVFLGGHRESIFNIEKNPGGKLFATTDGANTYLHSSDDGITWVGQPFYGITGGSGWPIGYDEHEVIYDTHSRPELAVGKSSIVKSIDLGANWLGVQAFIHTTTQVAPSWASLGNLWWCESYATGSSLILAPTTDIILPSTGIWLVRGLYNNSVVWIWGNFFNNLQIYDGGVLTSITLPALAAASLWSVVPFSKTLLFIAESAGGSAYAKIWRTTDGGSTWTLVLNDIRTAPHLGIAGGSGAQFISRNHSNINELALIALGGIFHSIDNGDTWTFITGPSTTIEFSTIFITGVELRRFVPVSTVVGAT